MAAQPRLAVVPEPSDGEILCENCVAREHEVHELLKKLRGQSRELGELRADKQAEAEADPLWPMGIRLFRYWQAVCRHPRAEWTPQRFEMVRRRLRQPGLETCLRAIAGVHADAWRVQKRLDLWEHIFESQKAFETCLAKCPASWTAPRGTEELL